MNPSDYTFGNVINTPSNQLARLAAQKICETPGAYNPLYIFGPPGVGKLSIFAPVRTRVLPFQVQCAANKKTTPNGVVFVGRDTKKIFLPFSRMNSNSHNFFSEVSANTYVKLCLTA